MFVFHRREGLSAADDSIPWIRQLLAYTRRAIAHPRVKVVGVCFGHQLAGRALGEGIAVGDNNNNKCCEMGVCRVRLSEIGRRIFGVDELVRAAIAACLACSFDLMLPLRLCQELRWKVG